MNARVYWSEASSLHHTGVGHPEHNGRINAALEGARRAGAEIRSLAPPVDTAVEEWIIATHDREYLNAFRDAVIGGGRLFQSLDNPISRGSFEAARGAVATALAAAEDVFVANTTERAFVVARPPGHHAERRTAMGFCFFNTIAVVAERLRAERGIERVFIFDWDVHHGNGTQHLFESRSDVFYASTHRFPFYPGTGAAGEVGSGEGRGFTLNVPFSAGSGDAEHLRAVEERIIAAIDAYEPDAILISAGFDSHRLDPLGGMKVSEQAFGEMTRRLVEAAERHCGGRLLSLLEGGYDMEGLASSVAQHVNALA